MHFGLGLGALTESRSSPLNYTLGTPVLWEPSENPTIITGGTNIQASATLPRKGLSSAAQWLDLHERSTVRTR